MSTTLHKRIMRRIYYAYVIRLVTLPGLFQGFLMLGALIALTYFVSLGSVIQNIEIVGLSGVGRLAYSAITNTEAWTLLIIGVMVFAALSFRFKIRTSGNTPVFAKV